MKIKVFILIFFSCLTNQILPNQIHQKSSLPFNKVVIWGHKLHSHTHSYIHWGFYRAFKHLGYDTYWFDNSDNVKDFDFSNSLFLTEHQVDQKIPIRDDCFYILHNCYLLHYERHKKQFKKGRCISLQVYRHEYIDKKAPKIQAQLSKTLSNGKKYFYYDTNNNIKLDEYTYYNLKDKIIYMPWATDLLPHEIEQIQKNLPQVNNSRKKIINYIGSDITDLKKFKKACLENNIKFNRLGGFNKKNLSMQENINKIQESYLAPAIQRRYQVKQGYIPCRIFKNISYGHIGATNSKTVYELFNKKIIYNSDPYQLFYDMQKKVSNFDIQEQLELMDFVKEKHTYINRIKTLLNFLTIVFNKANNI